MALQGHGCANYFLHVRHGPKLMEVGHWKKSLLSLSLFLPASFNLERESRAQSGRGRGGGKGGSRNARAQKARRIHIGTVSTPRNKCKAIIPNFMVWALSPDMK